MADCYKDMRSFQDELERLCRLCGVEQSLAEIPKPSKLVGLAQALARDDSISRFLVSMRKQVRHAAKLLEKQQIDHWNMEQSAPDAYRLETELEEAKKLLEAAQEDAQAQKARALMAESELQLLKEELKVQPLLKNNGEKSLADDILEEDIIWPGEEDEEKDEPAGKLIQSIISMRDKLQASLEWALDSKEVNVEAVKVLQGQLQETALMLNSAGVEILDAAGGAFNAQLQTAVSIIQTEDEDLAGTVARTFRAGYARGQKILRGQEVVLYELVR